MIKIKLIWDFRGINSQKTAEHHVSHLEEYFKIEKTFYEHLSSKQLNEMHSIAFVVVNETDVRKVRDALKPHRGELFSE